MKKGALDYAREVLRLDYFAVVFVSTMLAGVLASATGLFYYASEAGWEMAPGVAAVLLVAAFTLLSSRLFFGFSRKDALGLSAWFALMSVLAYFGVFGLAVAIGSPGVFWQALYGQGVEYVLPRQIFSLILSTLIYCAILAIFLPNTQKK